jgi:hypothetical protein
LDVRRQRQVDLLQPRDLPLLEGVAAAHDDRQAAGGPPFGLHADKKPGDVNGPALAGLWFVVKPSGKATQS